MSFRISTTYVNMNTLIFCVDSYSSIGTGHFMRCFALAQHWKEKGGNVVFITYCENDFLVEKLKREKFNINLLSSPYPNYKDLDYIKDIFLFYNNAWVILDGYQYDEKYQKFVKEIGKRFLVIDDMAHLDYYYADIVLNQNLHASDLNYNCNRYTELLCGTKYVILRKEFMKWRGFKRKIPKVIKRLLIIMGGVDRQNFTEKVIRLLNRIEIPEMEIIVVVGPLNKNYSRIKRNISEGKLKVKVIRDVLDISKLMIWADIAISSGGTTVWEAAFMGLPTIVGRTTLAEDYLVNGINKYKLFLDIGWFENCTEEVLYKKINMIMNNRDLYIRMSRLAQQLVDGYGVDRIIEKIQNVKNHFEKEEG